VTLAPAGVVAYLALGANLGEPLKQLNSGVREINAISGCSVIACSSAYQTEAQETKRSQPDYFNAVVAIETTLSAQTLWTSLAEIEFAHGRVRAPGGERNAARTLDIDLLLFGTSTINSPTLIVPHPRMHQRAFVLRPLLDVAPDVMIPGLGSAKDFFRDVRSQRIEKLAEPIEWT
jgi:2-amino-4-hydroxy-6-hydroxymethyldihydropteridine diphosphokinase